MTRLSSSVDWMWPQKESARLKISQQKFLKLKEKLKKKKKRKNRTGHLITVGWFRKLTYIK